MNKQVIIIYRDNKPVQVCEIKSFVDPKHYEEMCKVAKENFEKQENERLAEERAFRVKVENELFKQQKTIELLTLEVDLLRGKITEEEYEERKQELCGTK